MRSRLQELARQAVGARDAREREGLDERCRELLAELRKNCPDLVPPEPLPPGRPGPTVPVALDTLQILFHEALRPERGAALLWRDGSNELLVDVAKVRVEVADGLVTVRIPVACDETGSQEVQVPFAVGSRRRDAGFVVATELRPRGPVEIVELWAEGLVALAWRALLDVTAALAHESGEDLDGAGLVPFAVSAGADGLTVRTQARHAFDRPRSRRGTLQPRGSRS